jgi:hypothetical protein
MKLKVFADYWFREHRGLKHLRKMNMLLVHRSWSSFKNFRLAARRKRPGERSESRSSSIAPFRPSNIDTGQAERSQDRIGESS